MGGVDEPSVDASVAAELDRGEARLRALSAIGLAGMGAPRGTAVPQILLAAMRALDADSASLGVWDDDARALRVAAQRR